MIDILTLLEQKTRGNLTAEERQVLDQVLYELRLRYVQAQKDAQERPRIIVPVTGPRPRVDRFWAAAPRTVCR